MFSPLFTASVQLWLPAKTDSLSDLLHVWSVTKTRRSQEVEETPGWRLLSLTWGRYHWLLSLTISRELVGQKETLCKTLVRRNLRLTRMSMLTEGQRDWPVLYATQTWAIKLACKKVFLWYAFYFFSFQVFLQLLYSELHNWEEFFPLAQYVKNTQWVSWTFFISSTLLTSFHSFSITVDLPLGLWRAGDYSQLSRGEGRLHPGWVASSPLGHIDTNSHPHSHAHQQTI